MNDPLPAPQARFVSGPSSDAPKELADVVWFEVEDLPIALRPIHPEDKDALLEGFLDMSEQSRYQRFLAPIDRLSDRQATYLTDIDQVNHFAWVAGTFDADGELHGVGVARYVRSPEDATTAELAVAVADAAQGRGIGTLLVESLVTVAAGRGLDRIFGLLLAENTPMQRIFRALGATFERESRGVLRATIPLPASTSLTDAAANTLLEVAEAAAASAR